MARKAPVLPAKANAKAKAQMAPKALGMNSKNPMPAKAATGMAKKPVAMAKGGMAKKGKKC
jgi:hypothetical protein